RRARQFWTAHMTSPRSRPRLTRARGLVPPGLFTRRRGAANPYAIAIAASAVALGLSALINRRLAARAERENPPTGRFVEVDGVRLQSLAPAFSISDEMCEYILRRNNKAEDGVQYHLYLIACYKSLLPIWLSLPTPLTFVRTLRVDMQLSSHRSFQWGGSVNALAEASLQLFLRFFRHGPQLSEDRDGLPQKEQLRYRMPYLDMLTINLVPEPSRGDSQPVVIDRMTFRYLGSYLGVIARSDLFRGKIKAFRLRYGDLVQDHIIQPRKAP
ncbi:hypothetical protein MMC31_003156, partial [Peltigera leucophlebia]|nr:hypothetical protein [Peltigera leucophlebia]